MKEDSSLDRDFVEDNDSPPDKPADEKKSLDATSSGSHEF